MRLFDTPRLFDSLELVLRLRPKSFLVTFREVSSNQTTIRLFSKKLISQKFCKKKCNYFVEWTLIVIQIDVKYLIDFTKNYQFNTNGIRNIT